jgi:photosystem II stability/assembly factor-like uncharacterized protein
MWRSEEEMLAVVRGRAGHLRRRRRRQVGVVSAAAGLAAIVAVVAVTVNAGAARSSKIDVEGRPPPVTSPTSTARGGRAVPGDQIVQELTPLGPDVAWAYTVGEGTARWPEQIVRTIDAGTAWKVVTPPGLAIGSGSRSISAADFVDRDHAWVVYGASSSGAGPTVTATSDGGQSWKTLGKLPTPDCALQFVTANDGWCVTVGAAMGEDQAIIYGTTDDGHHWTLMSRGPSATGTPGTPGSLPVGCDKTVTFRSPNDGWAGFACNGGGGEPSPLYQSTDGGRTWVQRAVAPTPGAQPISEPGMWTAQPTLTGENGSATLLTGAAGTTLVIYRTSDGGLSWQPVTLPGPRRSWTADLVDGTQWKLFSGTAILSTDNAGRTWQTTRSGIAIQPRTAPVFVTAAIGWYDSGADARQVFRTADGGATWTRVNPPDVG